MVFLNVLLFAQFGGYGLGYPMFDWRYLLFMLPAMALAGLAQLWLSSAYARGQAVPTRMTGFMAARQILFQLMQLPALLSHRQLRQNHYN